MFKKGDVVFGKFATVNAITGDAVVLQHYSIVLQVVDGGLLLAYTTSLKDCAIRTNPANRFSKEDLELAGFKKPGLWDASRVCVVPNSDVAYQGRISKGTFAKIQDVFVRSRQSKALSIAMLTVEGTVELA